VYLNNLSVQGIAGQLSDITFLGAGCQEMENSITEVVLFFPLLNFNFLFLGRKCLPDPSQKANKGYICKKYPFFSDIVLQVLV